MTLRVAITGADGFVGKNLTSWLTTLPGFDAVGIIRSDSSAELEKKVAAADAVVHLAGENRPSDPSRFESVNIGFTRQLCAAIRSQGREIPLLFASSVQALLDNPYGASKRGGELQVEALAEETGGRASIYRLPNIFGKWCRPDYNSAVATFCHNIARGLPVWVDHRETELRLVYIDDVVTEIVRWLREPPSGLHWGEVEPVYRITLGDLVDQLAAFAESRETLVSERVGTGLARALYATYISYLPPELFSYSLPSHSDERGTFVEMLKTKDSGQFSFFTAHPGVTRGGHYHHTKTEKFLVLKGEACFRFRNVQSGERVEIRTSGGQPMVVETIPGWAHDITNSGPDELLVMLWANEIFDRDRPDTIAEPV